MKKKLSLYDWCIKNNRQDLINSLKKTGEIEKAKTFTYGSKKELLWYCDDCKKLYDKLIKDNPNLPKFYIQPYLIQNKTKNKKCCRICNHGSNKVFSSVNDFETFCKLNKNEFGHLLEEWDYDKNIVKPNEIFPNYTENVNWKCKNGHKWTASPNARINTGNGCKQCSEERRKSKAEKTVYYYIKQVFPNAIESYKIPKTRGLEIDIYIEELSLGIEYDGFWHNRNIQRDIKKYKICKDNHISLVRIREKQCEKTDNIADLCYYLKQENNKDLDNAIKFLFTYIKTRTSRPFETPDVNWKRDIHKAEEFIDIQINENSVANYPLLLAQWHPTKNGNMTPDRVRAQSNIPRYWRCLKCGYGLSKDEDWLVSPNSRIEDSKNNKINGCPSCAKKELHKGYNDFETCCNNKKYQTEYKKKYNKDLRLLLKEWNEEENSKIITKNGKPLTKDNILFGSSDEVAWVCSKCSYGKNEDWKTPLASRTVSGIGCPVCTGKIVVKGKNDINTTHPEIAKQWDDEKNLRENGRTKYNTSHGWKEKIWWICEKGHSYDASPNDRTNKGTGCRYCSNKDVLQGFNDLETFCNTEENKEANKHLLKEWQECNKLKPSEVVWNSNKIVKWKCSNPKCGHEWETAVRHRVTYIQENGKLHKGTGCDKCARKLKALNLRINKAKGKELSILNPKLAKEWHPNPNKNYSEKYGFILTPDNTSANSKDKVWWKCSICGHEWPAQVYARNKGSGCPECYKRGRKK